MFAEPTTRIHKNAIKAWSVNAFIFGLLWFVPAIIYAAIAISMENSGGFSWLLSIHGLWFAAISVLSLTLYILTGIVLPKLRWKRWKYDVAEKEIDMLRGIIIKKRTLVPMNRVQHVDTKQGPVYRRFGLSSVTISTAATTHEIPALDDDTANALRVTISKLVQKVKEDV